MASDLVKNIAEKDFDNETAKGVTLVDFWAEWCGPCRMIAPIVDQLAAKYKDKVKVLKANVDDEPGLANKFGIRGIPTLLLFKDAKLVETLVGVRPLAEIESALKKHLEEKKSPT
jgi:thioredoxin 1